jgi:Ca2+-binding RTX toxin-like protein
MPGTGSATALAEAAEIERREGMQKRPSFEVDLAGGEGASGVSGVVNHSFFLTEGQGVTVDVSFADGAWIVAERPLPVVAGDRCAFLTPETVSCPATGTPEGVYLYGSRAADAITIDPSVPASADAAIVGDQGTDTIQGGPGDDSIDGSGNSDLISGGAGDDALTGGLLLDGESGSDLLILTLPCSGASVEGGPGDDSVSFARATAGVEATLGGTAFEAGGEPESFIRGCFPGGSPATISPSVESIEGSPHDDVLFGDGHGDTLLGRGGDDELSGAGGDDFLVGGSGVDRLSGDSGADRLYTRDGTRDAALKCGGNPGDFALADPVDPLAVGCTERPALAK